MAEPTRLQVSDRPDGVVDWGYTLARGPHQLRPEYVVRSSGIGLDEEEHVALRGLVRWIADEWGEYTRSVSVESRVEWREIYEVAADTGLAALKT